MEETKETIMESDFDKDMKQLEDDGLLEVVEIPPTPEVYDATNAKDDPELMFMDAIVDEMPDINEDGFEVDMNKANSILYVIGKINQDMDDIKAVAQHQIDRAKMFQDTECQKMQRTVDFLTGRLHGFAMASGKRTVALPNGKLKLMKKQDKFEVVDEDRVFAWIKEQGSRHGMTRVKTELNKVGLKAHFKDTGEIPDGIDVTPQPDGFKAVPE